MKFLLPALMASFLISCNPKAPEGVANPYKEEPPILSDGDPLAYYAWHLENIGQKTFSSKAGIKSQDMDIKEAQTEFTGSGINIAVSDTGVDVDHPDLIDNQLPNFHRDYSNDSPATWANGGDPYPIEEEAHGTAVTGLAAATGWNEIGSRGVAPNAKYAGFLFVGDFHNSSASYEAKTLDQVTGPFDIFNYSYGYSGCSFLPTTTSLINAYKVGVTNLRSGKGAIYIKSAGNDYVGSNSDCWLNNNTSYLGNSNSSGEEQNLPYLILVGAVNAKGEISSYSTPGSGVWISAAGGEYGTSSPAMLTTDIRGCDKGYATTLSSNSFNKGKSSLNPDCDYTQAMNGTSSAAPVLSGIVALMLEANPNLTWRDVKHILAVTADPIKYSTAAMTHPSGGMPGHVYDYLYVKNQANYSFSNTYGFGRANAKKAVDMAKTYVSNLGNYLETVDPVTGEWSNNSGSLNLLIPDESPLGVSSTIGVMQNYVIESVQIKISTTHTYIGDLGVELTSPQGTTSRLLLTDSNIKHSGLTDYILLTNAFYGELSLGSWTIKVIDGAAADTGRLTNWQIKINGHIP